MSLAWPWVFLLLPMPWLVRSWLPHARGGPALRVPAPAAWTPSMPAPVAGRRELHLAACVWLLLLAAAARPQWQDEAQPLPVTGRDLMLAIDVSGSMATPDMRLDGARRERLQVARWLAADFVARREGDRVGLIVFGNQPFLHTPLTYDLQAVRTALEGAVVGLAGEETALGDAIALAAQRLREFGDSARVLVLLSDGANTAGALEVEQALWIARREGLRIHTIGIGARKLRVLTATGVRDIDPATDLDENLLRRIAEQTGGRYQRVTDAAALERFYQTLDRLEPVRQNAVAGRPARELYPWPLAAALALVAGVVVLRLRPGRD